jgi:Uma2 family endonuclease
LAEADGFGRKDNNMSVRTKQWTRRQYEAMVAQGVLGPQDHVQLIRGEIVEMTPQGAAHAAAVRAAEEILRRHFGEGYDVRVQLPLALGADSEPEPDVSVVTGSFRDYRDQHPRTALLVVEVADTTIDFDRENKRMLYAAAGVPEYWIVVLPDRTLEQFHTIQTRADGTRDYQVHRQFQVGETFALTISPRPRISVSDLFP